MNTTIYFIRHGDAGYSFTNYRERSLTIQGTRDAARIASTLLNVPFDVFISSAAKRAVQTIQPLAIKQRKDIQTYTELQELLVNLDRSIMTKEKSRKSVKNIFEQRHLSYPGGESRKEVEERAIPILSSIINRYRGQTIAFGTHGIVMTLLLSYFDPTIGYEFWESLKKPDIYMLVLDKHNCICSLTQIPLL